MRSRITDNEFARCSEKSQSETADSEG